MKKQNIGFLILFLAIFTMAFEKSMAPAVVKVEQAPQVWEREFQIMGEVYQKIGYELPTPASDSLRQLFNQVYSAMYSQYASQKHIADSLDAAPKPKK